MIDEHKYGSFAVDGKSHSGSIKIIEGRVRYWDPGEYSITKEDMFLLLQVKPDYVVIGLGPGGMFTVDKDVEQQLFMAKIKFFSGKNLDMVNKYNELEKDGKKVCAIFPCRG